ncbi:MAG: hypothetical protein OXK73_15020 [Rhodospirillaceae bacterium]|nr:hypothetical protein [Rhodospirillaceae bacterium]
MVVTVPMPLRMNVAGLRVNPLTVHVAMPVLRRMHVPVLRMNLMAPPMAILVPFRVDVPGLKMNPRAVPLAILVPLRVRLPGPYVEPRAVPLAMVVALGMDVPGSRIPQPHAPSVSMVPRMLMPSSVVSMGEEGTVVRGYQRHADAERVPVLGPLVGFRAEQAADDAAHDRSFPRPFVVGAGGRLRHGRAEHDDGRERDSANETPFPVPHHRHPPFSIGSR